MTFAPLDVVHWDCTQPPPNMQPTKEGRGIYFVVWNHDRPIGHHRWGPSSFPVSRFAWADAVSSILAQPAPEHAADTISPCDSPASRGPTVTVVVCTRDRAASLHSCLQRLGECRPAADEVIVVDNGSRTGAVRDVARSFAFVRYIRESRLGLDIARNTGAQLATGHIVAYVDDDVTVDPGWIGQIQRAFQDSHVMAVTGLTFPQRLDTYAQWIFESAWGFHRGYRRKDYTPDYFRERRRLGVPTWEIGAGANMAFRREVFERVGYFDVRLDVGAAGCSGDSEYWYRLLAADMTCRYEPSVVVHHLHRDTMDSLKRQVRAYMRGFVAALLVQFERHGHVGNLVRLGLLLPLYHAKRIVDRVIYGPTDAFSTIREEWMGCLQGFWFYLRSVTVDRRRWQAATRPWSADPYDDRDNVSFEQPAD